MSGTCQKCGNPVEHVTIDKVGAKHTDPKVSRAAELVSFSCGGCGTVLNIGPDPFWILRKLIARVTEARKAKAQPGADAEAEATS